MASLKIKYNLKCLPLIYSKVLLLLLIKLFFIQVAGAQNMHIVGGGITVGTGGTINVIGSITLGNTSTVTNNSNILLTGNWTNNGATYTGSTGTVSFMGTTTQQINGTATSHTFNHVVINQTPSAVVEMNADVNLKNLIFTSGKLSIGSNTLGIGGAVTNTVAQGLKGSNNSNISIIASNAAGTLSFDQAIPDTSNVIRSFLLNAGASTTIGNKLNIAAGTTTQPGTLTLANNSVLSTNDLLTLKSNASGTSRVAEIPVNGFGVAQATITGKVTVERWISARRAWRLLCMPLQHTGIAQTSIWNTWQEGTNNTVDLTTGGSYATDNNDINPGFGTHITCDNGVYNATTDGFDAASRYKASLLTHNGTDWSGRPLNTKSTYGTSMPGWMIFVRGSRAVNLALAQYAISNSTVLRSTGLLNTGRQTTTTVTNPSGYNLINNPYASGIDLTQCTLNGSAISTIGYYLWDPYILGAFTTVGGYTYYDPILGFLPSPVSPIVANRIESGSAFFVPSSVGQTLIIPEVSKVANNSLVLRPAGNLSTYKKMKTTLYIDFNGQSLQADACGQVMHENFDNNFLQNEDRLKLNNFSENLSITCQGKKVIAEYKKPYTITDTVFYTLNKMAVKNYHFYFEPSSLEALDVIALLEDKYTGTETPISIVQNTRFDFSVTTDSLSSASNRFQLIFKPSAALPVMFSNINATLQNVSTSGYTNDIMVQWQVQNETNIQLYELEKSTDGSNFEKIHAIAATANYTLIKSYFAIDQNTNIGNNFYRVRSIGIDGAIKISEVVKIYIEKKVSSITVYPNPVIGNNIFLQMNEMPKGTYQIKLTNAVGQLIHAERIIQNNTSENHCVKLKHLLPKGIYQLTVTAPNNTVKVIQVSVADK